MVCMTYVHWFFSIVGLSAPQPGWLHQSKIFLLFWVAMVSTNRSAIVFWFQVPQPGKTVPTSQAHRKKIFKMQVGQTFSKPSVQIILSICVCWHLETIKERKVVIRSTGEKWYMKDQTHWLTWNNSHIKFFWGASSDGQGVVGVLLAEKLIQQILEFLTCLAKRDLIVE